MGGAGYMLLGACWLLMKTEHLHPDWSLFREYPLTPQLRAVSQAWKLGAGEDVVVATKGAPEAIAALLSVAWWNWPIEKITQHLDKIVAGDVGALQVCDPA